MWCYRKGNVSLFIWLMCGVYRHYWQSLRLHSIQLDRLPNDGVLVSERKLVFWNLEKVWTPCLIFSVSNHFEYLFVSGENLSRLLYFYLPLCIIWAINVLLFALTVRRILQLQHELKVMLKNESSRHQRKLNKDKEKYTRKSNWLRDSFFIECVLLFFCL